VYIVLQAGVPATPETAKKIAEGVNKKVTRHKRITGAWCLWMRAEESEREDTAEAA